MKKFILLIALSLPIVMISCGEDEDPILTTNKGLSGVWNVTSYIEDGEEIINNVIGSITMTYTRDTENIATGSTSWLISDDFDSETINMTYIISDLGETITFSEDNKEFEIEIDGNQLSLMGVDEDMIQIKASR